MRLFIFTITSRSYGIILLNIKEDTMKKTLLLVALLSTTSIFAANGEALYKSCIACHGAKAEKVALNKSQIIAGWSSDKTIASLKGYKDGTYGGASKALMRPYVKNLSDEDIKTLAEYIATLK